VAYVDLYWMQTSLIINSTEAYAAVYSVVAMGDRRQGMPLAAQWGRRDGRRHDHGCI